jgi:flavin-dependent dehydrogenase
VRAVDVIIVGGGPAGSSCAWRLRRLGFESLVLDREVFPRDKLCGGWITPQVLADLELDPATYPHGFLNFRRLRIHIYGLSLFLSTVQHSIRRLELDAWLLERSGAEVLTHEVRHIEPDGQGFVLDNRFRCRHLVGAGGTRCPVYRSLFRERSPRDRPWQLVALERELDHPWSDGDCHLWFFDRGLPGYAWYVPKANGVINVGVGGFAETLKRRGQDIKNHWGQLLHRLRRADLVDRSDLEPGGYSYYAHTSATPGRIGNAWVIGDAAGLATRDLCEGIGPAVRSGRLAAEAIAGQGSYEPGMIAAHTSGHPWLSRLLALKYLR